MRGFSKMKSYLEKKYVLSKNGMELRRIVWMSFTITSMIATILMGISFYYRFSAQSTETIWQSNQTRMEQATDNVTTYFRSMMKICDTIYYRIIKTVDLSTDDITDELRLVYDMNKDYIENIALFSVDGEMIGTMPVAKERAGFVLEEQDWFQQTLQTEENIRFGVPQVSRLFVTEGEGYTRMIPMSRVVQMNFGDHMEKGVLLIQLRYSVLQDMLSDIMVGENSYVYLTDEFGNLIYHPYQEQIAKGEIPLVKPKDHKTEQATTIGYTGWNMIAVSGSENISLNNWKSRSFILFLLFFFLNAIMLINFYISKKVTEPMKRLERAVKKIEAGDLDTKIEASGVYEIQTLSDAIETMEKNLKQLMEDIVSEHEAKRKSDLMVLQNQINPHFLYNTLDIIVWMVENEKSDDAVRAVTALARFFRISLSKGRTIIPVADEIEHVRNYLMIQNMRYKNKFSYTFCVDEKTKRLGTIKLVLQPLVENAIYHAMEFMDDDGELVVGTRIEEDTLILWVKDNGCGMTQDKVDALLSGTVQETGRGSGVGVRNVTERIQLLFGEAYGLRIYSEPDEGTTVEVYIPAISYEDMVIRGMVS